MGTMDMAKTTMNVSISDSLKDLAQQQVYKNHYSTMSDYIQHLIRADVEKQKAQDQFDQFIEAGIKSGKGKTFTSREEFKGWMTQIIKQA